MLFVFSYFILEELLKGVNSKNISSYSKTLNIKYINTKYRKQTEVLRFSMAAEVRWSEVFLMCFEQISHV